MRKILLLLCAISYGLTSFGQKHEYEDLLNLYIDEKYEKCYFKAESYTLKDDCRKDPMPYLYISMSFFEMSKQEKYDEDYPKAFRNALKYAEKFRKKDKNLEFFNNYEDFWSELNAKCAEVAENFMDEQKWSKAKRYYDYMTSYQPENPGAWLLYSLSLKKYNDVRAAEEAMKSFDKAYASFPVLDNLWPDQKDLLKSALIRYAEDEEANGSSSAALALLEKGIEVFGDDKEFKSYYDSLK